MKQRGGRLKGFSPAKTKAKLSNNHLNSELLSRRMQINVGIIGFVLKCSFLPQDVGSDFFRGSPVEVQI